MCWEPGAAWDSRPRTPGRGRGGTVRWGGTVMERPERRKLDDEGLPLPPRAEGRAARWLLMIMERDEKVVVVAIAHALLVSAVVVSVRGVHDLLLAPAQEDFAVTVTRAVKSVLFIV